ncbi:MAG: aminopeptidase P family protein [Anaerolineae bacterium]|nr:aminopeptidase P family protein [Anaerolineae bacterium]
MAEQHIDVLALVPSATLSYLTGLQFHLMERPVVLLVTVPGETAMILPELEMPKLQNLAGIACYAYGDDPQTWGAAFRAACQSLDIDGRKIGVEPVSFRFLEWDFLQQAAPHASFVPADLDTLRIQKDSLELAAMRRAVKIAQQALLATLPLVKVGITERELASELTIQLLRAGSGVFPFDPIVSAGPNSANPHASPSDRSLELGDLLLFDWGASFNGYCSDLTRTFVIGKPEPECERIAAVVREANLAAQKAVRPGVSAGDVDRAARHVIEHAGYGAYFTHRVGHGLGMEAHEPPYLFSENKQVLQKGMTFTIEPGIYLMGHYGVRIEDNLVVTEDAAECLSDLPRELIVLG